MYRTPLRGWRLASASCLVAVVVATGCGPQLNDQRQLTLPIGEISTIVLAPAAQQQKIKVAASAPGGLISVYVYLNKHEAEVDRKITLDKPTDLILAHEVKSESVVLHADIPAREEAVVRIHGASRDADQVNLSITN